jgi:hypothetical protein
VTFKGKCHSKPLPEEDMRYLVATQFAEWKNFVITRHFRLELDIGQEQPLPKIAEVTGVEEDAGDQTDLSIKTFAVPEEEKPKLEATRDRLTVWFPI